MISVAGGFRIGNGEVVDDRSRFNTVAEALAGISTLRRHEGLGIWIASEQRLYRFIGGITNAHLVVDKSAGGLPMFITSDSFDDTLGAVDIVDVDHLTALDGATLAADIAVGSLVFDAAGTVKVITELTPDVMGKTVNVSGTSSGGTTVYDGLDSQSTVFALSAKQGSVLNQYLHANAGTAFDDMITELETQGYLV